MLQSLLKLFRRTGHAAPVEVPKIIVTESCIAAIASAIAPEVAKGHEGIAYLAGRTNGTTTLVVAVVRPNAYTTPGSFHVDAPSMAKVIRAIVATGLHVVGQVHTHPGQAYHSNGDDEGARIRYTGFASIVLPDYGRRLPSLAGAAAYMFIAGRGFVEIGRPNFVVVPERLR